MLTPEYSCHLSEPTETGDAKVQARSSGQERLDWVRHSYERFIEKVLELELELDTLKPIAWQSVL